MPSAEEYRARMQAIEQRARRALMNADPKFVEGLLKTYREGATSDDHVNALDMLEMFAKMTASLANDIELLLEENVKLCKDVEVYKELERMLK